MLYYCEMLRAFKPADTKQSEQLEGDTETVNLVTETMTTHHTCETEEEEKEELASRGLLIGMPDRDDYPALSSEYDPNALFARITDLFYGRDKEAWRL
jgi:hypothetical protein